MSNRVNTLCMTIRHRVLKRLRKARFLKKLSENLQIKYFDKETSYIDTFIQIFAKILCKSFQDISYSIFKRTFIALFSIYFFQSFS